MNQQLSRQSALGLSLSVPRPQDLDLCPVLTPTQQQAVCDFKTSGIGVMLQSRVGESSIVGYLTECLDNINILAGIDKPKKLSEQMQDMLIMGIMEVVRDFRNLTFGQFKRALINGMSGKYDPDGKVYGFTAKDVRQWLNAYKHELITDHVNAIQKQWEYERSLNAEDQEAKRLQAHQETRRQLLENFSQEYEALRAQLGGKKVLLTDIPEEIDRGNILYREFWKAKLIRCTKEQWERLVEQKKKLRCAELPGVLRAARSTKRVKQGKEKELVDYEQGVAEADARNHLLRHKLADCLTQDMPVELILQKIEQHKPIPTK